MANYFLELCKNTKNYKSAANWLINSVRSYLNENGLPIQDFSVMPSTMAQLIQLIDEDKVGNLVAKQNIFPLLVKNPNRSPLEIAESLNLIQQGDADFITTLVQKILAEHPKEVEEYKNLSNNTKGKVLFINAYDLVRKEKTISYLDPPHIKRIHNAYLNFKNEDTFTAVVDKEEILNDKNIRLSVQLFVKEDKIVEIDFNVLLEDWKKSSTLLKSSMDELFETLSDG